MNVKVVKSTTKGQITLPKEWRKKFKTDYFILEGDGKHLMIKPLDIEKEDVIFDADRDNKGKGVSVDEMIKLLKDI